MIGIFRTNVKQKKQAKKVIDLLSEKFPNLLASFDLEDSEKILRICGGHFSEDSIVTELATVGYFCEPLED